MFNRLRLKLTLTNVAVVSVIFLIFIISIFVVMQRITNDQTEQSINLISSNAGLGDTPLNSGHKNHDAHQYRYFYIRLNSYGDIISTSPGLDVNNIQIKNIISMTLASSKNNGQVELEDEHYRFVKNKLENGTGTSIIYVNTNSEHEMFDNLFAALAVAGIFGLILAFFGSLYMADRSLIPVKESWKRQKDFVADASHELRTPLSVIETTLDLVISKGEQTIDSQIRWLENIQTENKRMTKLVSDMLFLARTDSEQVALEKKLFPITSALLEAYIPFEAPALKQGIHLKPFEGPQIDFYGDESRIKQLAVILVDNAVKYTPSGGNVGMTLKDAGDTVEITVSDTGAGIDKEHINKIFQRFYRVDKARSRRDGSVGLGLSIADWIVKEHHGTIRVESIKGKGTAFHVFLPRARF